MEKFIYLDNAATTPVCRAACDAMQPYLADAFANPSSVYRIAQQVRGDLQDFRAWLADAIGAKPAEIYFTSGATESDNWAVRGAAYANRRKGTHIITSKIEHHAVLHTCEQLEQEGFQVTYLDVDADGLVSPAAVEAAIQADTVLISIMFANNEIGTIQPISEIGKIARAKGVLFHTDAVQAFCQVPIDVDAMNIDLLSASSHKIKGPKGAGLLYARKGIRLQNLVYGGGQERGKRPGTENVPAIAGFCAAAEYSLATMEERRKAQETLRDYLMEKMLAAVPHSRLNGHRQRRLPNNANFSFRFIEGESLLMMLDMKGICASSGSACTSGSLDPSHVLLAIGLPHETAHGSLRLTLSEQNTREEMDYVVAAVQEAAQRLRGMSPLYEDFRKENGNV
ncbi:MAG: cysteine desulfurase NifS [Clostridiales bacterium]|nr:cysteine desulfurase NifS [Clostridiales bacterium]